MTYDHILRGYAGAVPLKTGGQKEVYHIHHPSYGDAVLKVGSCTDARELERIQREVLVLRDIDSDYYPINHEFEVFPNNTFLMIEEYIDSQPLSKCMSSFDSIEKTLDLVWHLVVGLKILWDKRIVHRDLKPDNILIRPNDTPVIIDLGVARLLEFESVTTYSGGRYGPGTPNYTAPERFDLKTDIDIRFDQFNLGIIFMQLLIGGQHPFDPKVVGSGTDIVNNILDNNWCKPLLRQIEPSPLVGVVCRLLAHEPYQRYRLSATLLSELAHCRKELR